MKINLKQLANVGQKQNNDDDVKATYFKLTDGQSGRYRFLLRTPEDEFQVHAVHIYREGKFFKKFHCHRGIGGDFKDCPVCDSAGDDNNMWQKQIVFIPLLDLNTNEVVIWERPLRFFQENILKPLFLDGDICDGKQLYSTVFKITRQGSGRDTRYSINKLTTDEELMPEDIVIPDVSKYIATKKVSELLEFLRKGSFPQRDYDSTGKVDEEAPLVDPRVQQQIDSVPEDDVPF